MSEEGEAAVLAVVLKGIENKYFELARRILRGQLIRQRFPQRRVADEMFAEFFEPIGAGRHRDQPLRFADAVDLAVNADFVAAHRLASQAPARVRLFAARAGYVR